MNTKIPLELLIWVSGLLFLALTNSSGNHSSLCPLDNLGFNWCPGCGLGRSVRYFLHGDLVMSFKEHWFGIAATLILFYRISVLFRIFVVNLFNLNH